MTHLTPWSTRRRVLTAAAALWGALVVIPPWRVVAQDKPAPAAAGDTRASQAADPNQPAGQNAGAKVDDSAQSVELRMRARRGAEGAPKTGDHQFIGSIAAATLRIQPGADGVIMTMPVKEGDRVKRGDLLMQLDPHRADAALARTEAKLQLASAQVARLRAGVKAANVSQDELEQKEAELRIAQADLVLCKQDLDDTRILTPIDGVVSDLAVRAGERVTRGQRLATVIETGALKLYGSVPAAELTTFAVGQPLTVRVPAYPNRPFAAQVARIAPTVDPATATVHLEATLTGDTSGLLPGMFATATLDAPAKETPKQP